MQLFQKFEIEDNENPETKISFPEKAIIMLISTLLIRAAKKARKAKTYGDIYKIMDRIEAKIEKTGEDLTEKYGDFEDLDEKTQQKYCDEAMNELEFFAEEFNQD